MNRLFIAHRRCAMRQQILPPGSAEPQEALWLFGTDPIQALRYE